MNHCQNCKHWDLTGSRFQGFAEHHGECLLIGVDDDVKTDDMVAFTIARWDGPSGLITRSDFGCTLWENKE